MQTFVKLYRSEESDLINMYPNALSLLFYIARYARRTDEPNPWGLKKGQVLLGNNDKLGITPAAYRYAKKQLTEWGFVAFTTTNRGTTATLIDTRVFDINADDNDKHNDRLTTSTTTGQRQTAQHGSDTVTTTNKNKELKNKELLPPTPLKGEGDINLRIDDSPIEIQNQEALGGAEVHALRKWIASDLPHVSKIKTQLTNQNCDDLIEEFGKKLIQNVLEAMENVSGIQKKYTSVNLTVRNWAKKRVDEHPELKPKTKPVEMPDYFPQANEDLL